MKSLFVVAFLLAGVSFQVVAQVRNPTPTPTSVDPLTQETRERGREISRRSDDLRMTENFPVRSERDRKTLNEKIRPMYRESTEEEQAAIAPTDAVKASVEAFLNGDGTGLTRLAADIGCFTNDDVISAKPECQTYTMPGAGSAYSFRYEDYRIHRLADINFRNDRFEALGLMTHGILLYLGDVPLEGVTLESEGVQYLENIKPAKNFEEAGAFADKLLKGFKNNDFVYASVMKAIPGRTYVLRSIAYRGVLQKTVNGVPYNELDFDKRRDVTIAFRVAAMNAGQDITLVWKELRNDKAPKLSAN